MRQRKTCVLARPTLLLGCEISEVEVAFKEVQKSSASQPDPKQLPLPCITTQLRVYSSSKWSTALALYR